MTSWRSPYGDRLPKVKHLIQFDKCYALWAWVNDLPNKRPTPSDMVWDVLLNSFNRGTPQTSQDTTKRERHGERQNISYGFEREPMRYLLVGRGD